MDNIQNLKQKLRKEVLLVRKNLLEDEVIERSKSICNRILQSKFYLDCDSVCLYMPIRKEVDVLFLLQDCYNRGKKVYLPKVIGKYMEFYSYEDGCKLKKGAYDILEPDSEELLYPNTKTLIIMPGSVFTKEGNRIGYGGGYYDKYLDKYSNVITCAAAYDFQIVDEIPIEVTDQKVDYIVTETNIFLC